MSENVLAFQGSHRSISTLPLQFFFPRAYLVFSAFAFQESHVISAEPATLCCSPGPCWAKSITSTPLYFPCLPRLPQRKTDGFIVLSYSSLYGVSGSCPTSTTATFTVSSCLDMTFLSILYQPDILIMQLWSRPQRQKSAGSERRWDIRTGVPRNYKVFGVSETKKLTESESEIYQMQVNSDRETERKGLNSSIVGWLVSCTSPRQQAFFTRGTAYEWLPERARDNRGGC